MADTVETLDIIVKNLGLLPDRFTNEMTKENLLKGRMNSNFADTA